jgi:hypothetical protein
MPLNFPNSPTDGQVYSDSTTGNRYTWDNVRQIWKWSPNTVSTSVSALPPGSPAQGTLWWNTEIGRLFIYYVDDDSGQWVETNPVPSMDNMSDKINAAFSAANSVAISANSYTNTKTQFAVNNNSTTLINTGYTTASFDAGANVAAYGTWTPDPANGNYQYANSNGAFTLAAPSQNCGIDILLTNSSNANSITFTGFTVGGSSGTYATTSGFRHVLTIRRINNISTYSWYPLQ